MIISPTEPPELRAIGRVGFYPERHGCDIYFVANGHHVGIQRKEIGDFFGSMEGKKLLPKQLNMMMNLDVKYLIIEGEPKWTMDGHLIGKSFGQRWTRDSYRGVLLSIAAKGVIILHSKSLADTIEYVRYLESYHKKDKHHSLDGRDSPFVMFGSTPTQREFAVYVLQSLPGVGPELADRIFNMYGLPLQLTVGVEQLCEVEGVGKKKAEAIVRSLTPKKASALINELPEGEVDLT